MMTLDLEGMPSKGAEAVLAWSRRIHGPGTARHHWAEQLVDILDNGGRVLPEFPARGSSTRRGRMETALRIYREANDSDL